MSDVKLVHNLGEIPMSDTFDDTELPGPSRSSMYPDDPERPTDSAYKHFSMVPTIGENPRILCGGIDA